MSKKAFGWAVPLAIVMLVLFVRGRPPEPLPYKSDAAADVRVVAGPDYESSTWWGCSWEGSCPRRTWTWCLDVSPLTVERAWQIYEHQHEHELSTVREHKERWAAGSTLVQFESFVEQYRANVFKDGPELDAPVRAEVERRIAAYRQAELDLEAWERKDPARLAEIFKRMQSGVSYVAAYSIGRAGKIDEVRGWGMGLDRYGNCVDTYGNARERARERRARAAAGIQS
jgi:hypothetical protein